MTSTFENAKAGDKVWDSSYGHGVVLHYNPFLPRPLIVDFNVLGNWQYTTEGKHADFMLQSLFWDEIKFEAPTQPQPMKLIHGVEVPDISIKPAVWETYCFPDVTHPDLYDVCLTSRAEEDLLRFRITHRLCYPDTKEGIQAAILHTKAMLEIKE